MKSWESNRSLLYGLAATFGLGLASMFGAIIAHNSQAGQIRDLQQKLGVAEAGLNNRLGIIEKSYPHVLAAVEFHQDALNHQKNVNTSLIHITEILSKGQ